MRCVTALVSHGEPDSLSATNPPVGGATCPALKIYSRLLCPMVF